MSLQRSCFGTSQRVLPSAALLPSYIARPLARQQSAAWAAAATLSQPAAVAIATACSAAYPIAESGAAPKPASAHDGHPASDALRCLTIVTGASRGLGAAVARVLAANGPPLPRPPQPAAAARSTASGAASSPPSHASLPSLIHDMVLLSTDSARLDAFVRQELAPLLEHQQQQHQQQLGATVKTGAREQSAAAATTASLPSSAAATTMGPTAKATTATTTRIHTVCFDLGDLDSLEANTARLLSPRSPCQAGPGDDDDAGDGGMEAAAAASGESASSDAPAAAKGVLPLRPSAYAHVLLVHNAGQVGDLAPLELQGLANMRRQTDINVTSFAHLTSAVLRAFLHTPLSEARHEERQPQPQLPPQPHAPELRQQDAGTRNSANMAAAADVAQADDVSNPIATSTRVYGAPDPPPPRRRVISIVNISSVSVDQPYEHFSLYGMGKAARHMIVRSVAHEAALREASEAAAAVGGCGYAGGGSLPAWVRALSYAPGAIDTEMQAAAREALPAGPLKARFEDNARAGRLVDPRVSARVLYDILAADTYSSGAHMDFYSVTTATASGAASGESHPLTRGA